MFSALLDLVGPPIELSAAADRAVAIPGGGTVFRRWRAHMSVGTASIDVTMNFGPTFSNRTIYAHGLFGSATLDLDANTCVIDRNTTLGVDFDRYSRTKQVARQLTSQARNSLLDYVLSKLKVRNRGNPYQATIIDSVGAFYSSLISKTKLDVRIDGPTAGVRVIDLCARIIEAAGVDQTPVPPTKAVTKTITNRPTVLVLGATGFIGVELVAQLLRAGYSVRALVRRWSPKLEQLKNDYLEIVQGDMLSEIDLRQALQGIKYVFHLARADVKTWADYLKYDVHLSELVGRLCTELGIERLVYTGTINSFYAGSEKTTITEKTPLDPKISRRNYYARAKAAGEEILSQMHRSAGLPVVILRPGIVLGTGGTPFHWGVGMWGAGNICQVWGTGENKLPFVLVSDVASALVRSIQVSGIEGRSYNLIDIPMLSARDYIAELEKLCGIKVRAFYTPIWRFYLADMLKWIVKVIVGHPDQSRIPSYFDWNSRTQRAHFDCAIARKELGWTPASDRNRLITEGIGEAVKPWLDA